MLLGYAVGLVFIIAWMLVWSDRFDRSYATPMGLAMVLAFFPGWLEVTLHQDPIGTVAVTVLPFALWVAGSSRQKEHPTIARGIATVSMGFGFVFLLLTGGYVGAVVAIGVSYLAGVGLTQLWLLGSRSDYRRPG